MGLLLFSCDIRVTPIGRGGREQSRQPAPLLVGQWRSGVDRSCDVLGETLGTKPPASIEKFWIVWSTITRE
ncbi:MAG: hypothetical protein Q7T56_07280 [Nocardioidaceae bacterium]|nr:hypothetical protein [Nocardioidaceae bacterium]